MRNEEVSRRKVSPQTMFQLSTTKSLNPLFWGGNILGYLIIFMLLIYPYHLTFSCTFRQYNYFILIRPLFFGVRPRSDTARMIPRDLGSAESGCRYFYSCLASRREPPHIGDKTRALSDDTSISLSQTEYPLGRGSLEEPLTSQKCKLIRHLSEFPFSSNCR